MSARSDNRPRLVIDDISHAFFGVPVVKNISLEVGAGEVLGLVGENGAGKSTLMNIVGGVFPPVSGTMRVDGEPYLPSSPAEARTHGIAHVHQELNLFTYLSVADNVFLADYPSRFRLFTDRATARRRTREALDLVELDCAPNAPVESLSPGERQLLEIAKATVHSPRLMILDEPTTSLTSRETDRLFTLIHRLRDDGMSFIYVSHILEDVRALSDRVAIMRDGALVDVVDAQSVKVSELITAMVGRPLDSLFPQRQERAGDKPVLEVRDLQAQGLVDDISFTVHEREVVGIFGLMGAGRTELARVLYGLEQADSGTVLLNGQEMLRRPVARRPADGLAFVTEDRRGEGLLMEYPVQSNVALPSLRRWARGALLPVPARRSKEAVAASTEELRLKAANLDESPVRALSGGNQQKVVLAKWLVTRPKVLILDEPTRGIDVGAKYEVYRAALEQADAGAGLLIISSELPELLGLCDRILVMRMGRLIAEYSHDEFDPRRILGAAFSESAPQEER